MCLGGWQMSGRLAKYMRRSAMCLASWQSVWAGRKNVWAVGNVHARLAKCLGWSEKCLRGWLNACAVGKVHARSAKMPGRLAKNLRRLAKCLAGRQCACAGRQKCLASWQSAYAGRQFRDFQQEKTFWAIFTVSMASFP